MADMTLSIVKAIRGRQPVSTPLFRAASSLLAMTATLSIVALAGCNSAGSGSAAAPAKKASASTIITEADLVKIVLDPKAETRLGIKIVKVEELDVPRTLSLGGDLIVPPGRSSVVAAPWAGTLMPPEGGAPPLPGLAVVKGQVVFRLRPLLSPERALLTPLDKLNLETQRADADGKLAAAKLQHDQAKIVLDRNQSMVTKRLLPETALADVKNAYDQTKTALDAASERVRILKDVAGETNEQVAPIALHALADGVLRTLPVQVGQRVTPGTILFDVVSLNPLLVRVPVFVGDLNGIATDKPATVGPLAAPASAPGKPAKPVAAPPSADPLLATADLFYEVENKDGTLRPGQRVGVTLPLAGQTKGPTVPQAALLRDIDGGSWVYESLGKHVFARRRVVVDRVVAGVAVLALGPKVGTPVVTDGAAELFGVEFGGGK